MKQPNRASRHHANRWSPVAWAAFTQVCSASWMAVLSRSLVCALRSAAAKSIPPITRRGRPLHLRSVIAFANMHHQVPPALHPNLYRMEQAVGLQRFGLVGKVVLMPQFVGDILERLL